MSKYNWNYPTTMWVGENRIADLGSACKQLIIKSRLLVTDSGLAKTQMVLNILEKLKNEGFKVSIFSKVVGNPTGANVKEGVEIYNKDSCDGVIAFG